jgi:hypothetical protein
MVYFSLSTQKPEDDYNSKEKWDAEIISLPIVQLVHYYDSV